MAFEQAAIKIERAEEFERLRQAVDEALSPSKVQGFLKWLQRRNIRVRDFDAILAAKVLEGAVGRAELSARQLYESLTVSDQAQIREFYLSKLETVDTELRHKFKKLYQYY